MPKSNFKIDELILVLIVAFIALFISFYDKANEPEIHAEKITEMILNDDLGLASNGIVDESKLRKIQNTKYESLKKSFNAKNDFCMYIEDENGNIILAKGSAKLSQDGLFCSE